MQSSDYFRWPHLDSASGGWCDVIVGRAFSYRLVGRLHHEDNGRMTDSYATAKAAYRELLSTIGPWARANGYRRWAGTQAGWQKPVDAGQRLLFKFEGYSLVNPDTGNSFHGLVQLEPLDSRGSTILRQSNFSCCLVQAELDELARIQGAINRRRPPLPGYLKKDVARDSLLGHHLRALYDPTPRYQEGRIIYFSVSTRVSPRRSETARAVAGL